MLSFVVAAGVSSVCVLVCDIKTWLHFVEYVSIRSLLKQ